MDAPRAQNLGPKKTGTKSVKLIIETDTSKAGTKRNYDKVNRNDEDEEDDDEGGEVEDEDNVGENDYRDEEEESNDYDQPLRKSARKT